MNDLDLLLNNSMTAISLLLIFVTTIFSMKYEKIKKCTAEDIEEDQPMDKKRQKRGLKKLYSLSGYPLFFLI